ncbi:MAG TPA: HSP20 family small heat-shock protein [Kofleriaceae bacterium]|nr:HSP20 family small heat-shock protein [Kofleriaceae bacterium]
MRDMLRWDPFREMVPTSWLGPGYPEPVFTPAFEVKETKDAFEFKADLPGVKEPDLEVKLTGNRLSVIGKRESEKEDKQDTYYTYERSYGSFQRLFTLPEGLDVDHVVAELKEGVLNIVIPKRPSEIAKTVAVKTIATPKS